MQVKIHTSIRTPHLFSYCWSNIQFLILIVEFFSLELKKEDIIIFYTDLGVWEVKNNLG